MVVANESNFWAAKDHAATKFIAKVIIKTGATVDGDTVRRFGLFHSFIIAQL